jgi:lipopolysaccharide transport system ATP-binding protein
MSDSDTVISVESLSKRYLVGHEGPQERYHSLRDTIVRHGKNFLRKTADMARGKQIIQGDTVEEFWALKGVTFEVKQGEVLGIIGRNGAGKSTLLKVLSRITEPTCGRVILRGRVASLLEVGTGFHPELTGRENIFLNAAILGMKRGEVKAKFDEIVDFAGVENFLDTPVKRYSSGMYVRLAFAVAAHLDPDILIIDEVLAVGDAEFQKKCLGKMQDVAKGGRTVLFVSHNMAALNNLCSRALILGKGRIQNCGIPQEIVAQYLSSGMNGAAELAWPYPATPPGNDRVKLQSIRIRSNSNVTSEVMLHHECHIEIEYCAIVDKLLLSASIHLLDNSGVEVLASGNLHSANLIRDDWFGQPYSKGSYRTTCIIPANFLNEGRYSIRVALLTDIYNVEFLTDEIIGFNARDGGEMRKEYGGHWIGVVRPKLAWQTIAIT